MYTIDEIVHEGIIDSSVLGDIRIGVVLGAGVRNGKPTAIYADRLDTAVEMYKQGVINRILVSGAYDDVHPDEITPALTYLYDASVDTTHVITDSAGFDTYDSIYRLGSIFDIDAAYIITQRYHLHRALFIGRARDMKVYGVIADRHAYEHMSHFVRRERLARVKAMGDIILHSSPRYGGEKIGIQ